MALRPILDNILVEVESEWKDQTVTKSGVIAVAFENEIDRGAGAQRKGKVVAVPRAISQHHYLLPHVQETVQVGDIVYFHFNSILEDTRMEVDIMGKPCYTVHLEKVFCMVRDGQIIMYGGRVLCEPIYDDDIIDLGSIKAKATKSGIIKEINVKHNLKKARVAHIGLRTLDRPGLRVKVGDVVVYEKDADFENEIEGKTYFCMIQEDLMLAE